MEAKPSDPDLARRLIEQDLPWLHKQRWARIAADLRERIDRAAETERPALQAELDAHYATRFDPEASRAALLAEAGLNPAGDAHGG